MPKVVYIEQNFSEKTMAVIDAANQIIVDYAMQGYNLTLRQLYYQFVARAYIENTERSYKRLGNIVSDARRAGLIDWDAIEDRTRFVRKLPHWTKPSDIMHAALQQFRLEIWESQPVRVEVWIEKDALVGVIEQVCNELDVPYFSCRGYVSDSEMWVAGQRIVRNSMDNMQITVILHLGDHDPSGIDMTRDITARLRMFSEGEPFEVRRLALNLDQIEQYDPPPNPTKLSDSRCNGYMSKYGEYSWELDALSPPVLAGLIRSQVLEMVDIDEWQRVKDEQAAHKEDLGLVSDNWERALGLLKGGDTR